jgi:hypothetical protein
VSTDNTISVPWPPLQLGEAGWRYRLESIANQAEALIGRKVVGMQQTAELGLELFGLIWPAYGPETVAATARASLMLNTPVVMASAPADQLQEIAERLDAIWEAAQSDPAAAVVTVPAPLLQRVQESQTRPGRRKAVEPDPEPTDTLELEPAAELEPEPAPLPQSPVKPLRPASERMLQRPDPVEPDLVELPEPWRSSEPEPWPPMAEPEALPVAIAPTPAPPSCWLTGNEVAELVGVSRGCVATWRRDGRLGVRNVDWVKYGRSTYFAPAVVEQLKVGRIPAGLDQLVAEVQAP